jgi:hypothetical protein
MIITELGIRSRPALARWPGRYAQLTVIHDTESATESDGGACRSLLDEIVRDGGRQMLAAALKSEVSGYCSSSSTTSTSAVGVWWYTTAIFANAKS